MTLTKYDYGSEFIGKNMHSGTVMPLSQFATELVMYVSQTFPETDYAVYAYRIHADFRLNEAGKLILARERTQYKETEGKKFLPYTRIGSLVTWGERYNERIKILNKVKKMSKTKDWQAVRKTMKEYRPQSLALWMKIFDFILTILDHLIRDRDVETILESFRTYIKEMEKEEASLIPQEAEGYELVLKEDPLEVCRIFGKLIANIKSKLWSQYRLNIPRFCIKAIRHRIEDKLMADVTETSADWYADRGRGPTGTSPFNQLWMLIYLYKLQLVTMILDEYERIYKIQFNDPIRDPDYYWKFTHLVPGLYIHGDNGMLIRKDGSFVMYDLSVSDAFQAYIRKDEETGDNLPWFLRLDNIFDFGPTGDPFTPYWTLEGQLAAWRTFLDGNLENDFSEDDDYEDWCKIPNEIDEADTHLGHYFDPVKRSFRTRGLRINKDKSDARMGIVLRGKPITFTPQHVLYEAEFAQALTASGLLDFDLPKFYDWIKKQQITWSELEYAEGIVYRMDKMTEGVKIQFLENFKDIDLGKFAEPCKVEKFRAVSMDERINKQVLKQRRIKI